jgi:mono/diheme cytochrome c family protein
MTSGKRLSKWMAAAIALSAWGGAQAQSPAPPAPTSGAAPAAADGKALVDDTCTGCHGLSVISAKGRTPADWSDVVDRMAGYGMTATDPQLAQIKAYLAKTYPPAAAP